MKEILSLLTAITLITSSSVSVLSCSNEIKTNKIVTKIEGHTTILLENVFGNVSTGDKTVIQAMKDSIKTTDGLSKTDVSKINFEVKNINNINYTEVDIYVNDNNKTYTIRDVKFKTSANKTQSLAHKIQNGQVNNLLPVGTNPDTSNADTITAMKNVLKTSDNLTDTDIAALTFATVTLNTKLYKIVNITVKLGNDLPITVSNVKFKIQSNTPPTPGVGLGKSKNVPFIDVTSVSSGENDLSADDVYNKFGQHQIMAAFVSAYSNSGAAWTQSQQFSDQNTKEAKWIKEYEALGGKVGISFGGQWSSQHTTTPWDYLTTDQLTNMLNTAINVYKAKAIDYDIEPNGNFDQNKMDNLVTATNNILKTNPGIDISLTLAVEPIDRWKIKFWGGPSDKSTTAVNEFKKLSKTPIINPMAFDFGGYYIPTENDYLPKIENIAKEAADYWSKVFNIDRTKFLQNNIEITTMIGRSDQAKGPKGWREFLDKNKATEFAKWAKSQSLYRLSYWCLNRDFPGNPAYASEHNNGTNNPAGTFNKINLDNFEN